MADTAGGGLQVVLRAVLALYGNEGAEHQRQANEFLVDFARTEAAWRVGMQILCDASLQTSTETLFFAANMIHAKARKEWMKLSDGEKQSLVQMIQTLLQEVQGGDARPALRYTPLQSKLCGIFAVALCSVPADCRALLDTLIADAASITAAASPPASVGFFITFARCVCEEMEEAELSFAAKDAMELHLGSLSADVVRVLADVMLSTPSSGTSALHGEALQCLKIWMKKTGMSLTRLYVNQPMMLRALVDALGQHFSHLQTCAEILCQVFKVSEYPAASLQVEALVVTAGSLLSLRAAYESAVVAEEEEIAHAITDVIATFAETYADWIIGGEVEEAVALGELMLVLGLHPRRQIASLTLEFWLLVQEEPVAERHLFFQREAFIRLLDGLLMQCRFPDSPDEMDEFELDDLKAYRSGSQGVSDVLVSVFALLKAQFLAQVMQQVSVGGGDWRAVEVCLFSVSNIAEDLKKCLTSKSPQTEALEAMVVQIIELLFQAPAQQQHALVAAMGAQLLGKFGSWFHDKAAISGSLDVVSSVLQYLGAALAVAPARSSAAKSFMQVSTSCAPCLVGIAPTFLTSVVQHFGSRHLRLDDRLLVVEGLVRVATQSPHATAILEAILSDSLSRLDQAVDAQAASEHAESVVCEELHVCSKAVRFLDAPNEAAGGKSLTSWVVETVWPHLEPVSVRLSESEGAMNALFELYGWCLQSLREAMGPHLPSIANLIVRVFEQRLFVAPLECGSIAVDVFGRRADYEPVVLESFRRLMGVLSRIAFQFFTTRGVNDAPDVLRALFELAYRFLLYCPAAVITAPEFPVLLELSRACIGNQDRSSTNAVLMFVTYLLQESRGKLSAFQDAIDQCFWAEPAQLELWVDAVLAALAVSTPSVLYEAVGRVFLSLWIPTFEQYGVLVATLTGQSLRVKGDVLGMHELSEQDRERITQLWFHYAQEQTRYAERKFRGLCGDFAKICRKELTPDVLQSYDEER